jgi:hypothetical protein
MKRTSTVAFDLYDSSKKQKSNLLVPKTACYTIQEAIQQGSLYDYLRIQAPAKVKIKHAVKSHFLPFIQHDEHTKKHIEWFVYYAFRFDNMKVAQFFFDEYNSNHHIEAFVALEKVGNKEYTERVFVLFPTIKRRVKRISNKRIQYYRHSNGGGELGEYTKVVPTKETRIIRNLIKDKKYDVLKQELQSSLKGHVQVRDIFLAHDKKAPSELIPFLIQALECTIHELVVACIEGELASVKREMNTIVHKSHIESVGLAFKCACRLGHIECASYIIQHDPNIFEHCNMRPYLHYAMKTHNIGLIRQTLNQSKEYDRVFFKYRTISDEFRDLLNVFWQEYEKRDLYTYACKSGNLYVLRRLIYEYKVQEEQGKYTQFQNFISEVDVRRGIYDVIHERLHHILKFMFYCSLFDSFLQSSEVTFRLKQFYKEKGEYTLDQLVSLYMEKRKTLLQ